MNHCVISFSHALTIYLSYFRNEGFRGFFKGAIPNILRVAPSAALTLLVYEECLKLLDRITPTS